MALSTLEWKPTWNCPNFLQSPNSEFQLMLIRPFNYWAKFKAWRNLLDSVPSPRERNQKGKCHFSIPDLIFFAVLGQVCDPLWLELEVGPDRRIPRTPTPVSALGKGGCAGHPPVIEWFQHLLKALLKTGLIFNPSKLPLQLHKVSLSFLKYW